MEGKEKVYCPPTGEILDAAARANLDWWQAFGEWIDNAFDAGALTVQIECEGKCLKISDDGNGCKNPADMIRLGKHSAHMSTKLGRYGIGGKDAALWTGGIDSTITITTIYQNIERVLVCNWREYKKEWALDPPIETQINHDRRGTTIEIYPMMRRLPSGQNWRDLLDKLGYLYSAAIKRGRQIKFKHGIKSTWEPLQRWEMPPLQGHHIDTNIAIGKKTARVYCGIVQDGVANPKSGFTYLHEWRVIEQASAHGCGSFNPSRICGFVDLDTSWILSRNKDALSGDTAALYASVEETCRPILERAENLGTELRSKHFEEILNRCLNRAVEKSRITAKAKRSKSSIHSGTKIPTSTGGKHRQAQNEQIGNRFNPKKPRPESCWHIRFGSLGRIDETGQIKQPSTILLNTDNFKIAEWKALQNLDALLMAALGLLAVENCTRPPDVPPLLRDLPRGYSTEDFSRATGILLIEDVNLGSEVHSYEMGSPES